MNYKSIETFIIRNTIIFTPFILFWLSGIYVIEKLKLEYNNYVVCIYYITIICFYIISIRDNWKIFKKINSALLRYFYCFLSYLVLTIVLLFFTIISVGMFNIIIGGRH